jgi:hypothetical protein
MYQRLITFVAAVALLAMGWTGQADQSIPGLQSTGVASDGSLLSNGAADPHYSVTEAGGADAAVLNSIPGNYLSNGPDSRWIWQNADGAPNAVTRTFRLSFDLTGLDPNTAELSGQWATDNEGLDILINGTSTGNEIDPDDLSGIHDAFNQLHAFSVTSGFVSGTNTLDFVVKDNQDVAGFRASGIDGTAEVPTPASGAVLGLAGLLLGLRRRPRSRRSRSLR